VRELATFDLILCDLNMPDTTGTELYARPHLTKPFTAEELREFVRSLLEAE
jgi:CheY-like chemotaxis protein